MKLLERIEKEYNFSSFEIRVLKFFFLTLFSEMSKFFFIGAYFLFLGKWKEFIIATIFLLILRIVSGGLHLETYLHCLCFSFCYLFLCIEIFPLLSLNKYVYILLWGIFVCISYFIGPLPSKNKHNITKKHLTNCKKIFIIIIVLTPCILSFISNSFIKKIIFWIVFLHMLQLIISKLLGGNKQQ